MYGIKMYGRGLRRGFIYSINFVFCDLIEVVLQKRIVYFMYVACGFLTPQFPVPSLE